MTPEYFRTFARYNAWANRRLYDAVALLPDGEIQKPRPAFFGSILGTLNHLLVADRLWLGRIEGTPVDLKLDAILHHDLSELRRAREAEDARILAVMDSLEGRDLAAPLVYRNTRGQEFSTPLVWVLAHLFNHQTHHRGQTHDLLSQTEVPPPPLDLVFYLRETGQA